MNVINSKNMSLDITIISPESHIIKSTCLLIRDNGSTREVTPEECLQKFPDVFKSIDEIPIQEYETHEFWSGNITHNLTEMAKDCLCWDGLSLYQLLWRDNPPKFKKWTYIAHLSECLNILKDDPEHFKKFNPENGWGTYEQLCNFVEDFIKALITMPEGSHIEYSK